MAWGRMDDGMADHPKIVAAGNAAVGAWTRLTSWSNRYATDGLLPAAIVRQYASRAELSRLRAPGPSGAPMVHGPNERCRCVPGEGTVPAGWYAVHDFDQYNERAIELAVRERDADTCRYCGVVCTATGPRRLVLDHVDPRVVCGAANLVVACHACNAAKGSRTPAEAGMTVLPAPGSNGRTTMARTVGAGRGGAGTHLPATGAYAREAKPGSAGPTGVRDRLAVPDRTDHSGQPFWRTDRGDDGVPDWPPVDAERIP